MVYPTKTDIARVVLTITFTIGCFIWAMVASIDSPSKLEHDKKLCQEPEVSLWIFKTTEENIIVGTNNKTACCFADLFGRESSIINGHKDIGIYVVGQSRKGKRNGNEGRYEWIFECPSKDVFKEKEREIDTNREISWFLTILGIFFSCICLTTVSPG